MLSLVRVLPFNECCVSEDQACGGPSRPTGRPALRREGHRRASSSAGKRIVLL